MLRSTTSTSRMRLLPPVASGAHGSSIMSLCRATSRERCDQAASALAMLPCADTLILSARRRNVGQREDPQWVAQSVVPFVGLWRSQPRQSPALLRAVVALSPETLLSMTTPLFGGVVICAKVLVQVWQHLQRSSPPRRRFSYPLVRRLRSQGWQQQQGRRAYASPHAQILCHSLQANPPPQRGN